MRAQPGAMLVGMLAAVTAPVAVLAVAAGTLESQATSFGIVGGPEEIVAQLVGQGVCSAPALKPGQQPLVVYASSFRFGYESPCPSGSANDQLASYRAPDAQEDDIDAISTSPQTGRVRRTTVWEPTTADTVAFFFQDDRTTRRTDDFVMMRQVGNRRPEPVLRNLLAYPGRPFFQYYYRKTLENGRRNTYQVPASWLPLQHTAKHGTAADTGVVARIDTLRAIDVNYRVTNGRTGTAERIDSVSVTVVISSLGTAKKARPCEKGTLFRQASYVPNADDENLGTPTPANEACSADW